MNFYLGTSVFSSVGDRGYIATIENGGDWIGVFWAKRTGCYWYKEEEAQYLVMLPV